MSKSDDRENTPQDAPEDADRALGTGAEGDVENPATGLDAPTVVEPIGTELVGGVGVAGDAPEPAAEPTATAPAAPAATEQEK